MLRRRLWRHIRNLLPLPAPRPLVHALPSAYLRGTGCEIGALHNPLRVPAGARVRYVDRFSVSDLRAQYPELKDTALVPVDIVTDGEKLCAIQDATQDFVIARNFIEHCEDPIGTLKHFLRVLKPGGIIYLGIPDKRHTFDDPRPITPLRHILDDHELGPERSRRAHFEEVARFSENAKTEADVHRVADDLIARNYSIHFHVWSPKEMMEMLGFLSDRIGFEIEALCRDGAMVDFILRKTTPA